MKKCVFCLFVCFIVHTAHAAPSTNTIVVDDLEFYIEADKSTYLLGENVNLRFSVTNSSQSSLVVGTTQTPNFDIYIKFDSDLIWAKFGGYFQELSSVTFGPGEILELMATWDMTDFNGVPISPGVYDISGIMFNEVWHVENNREPVATEIHTPITIIPEPTSIVLLIVGLIGARRKMR